MTTEIATRDYPANWVYQIDISKLPAPLRKRTLQEIENTQLRRDLIEVGARLGSGAVNVLGKLIEQGTTRAIVGSLACALIAKHIDPDNSIFWGTVGAAIPVAEISKDIGLFDLLF